jgi:hypothetical protein
MVGQFFPENTAFVTTTEIADIDIESSSNRPMKYPSLARGTQVQDLDGVASAASSTTGYPTTSFGCRCTSRLSEQSGT